MGEKRKRSGISHMKYMIIGINIPHTLFILVLQYICASGYSVVTGGGGGGNCSHSVMGGLQHSGRTVHTLNLARWNTWPTFSSRVDDAWSFEPLGQHF